MSLFKKEGKKRESSFHIHYKEELKLLKETLLKLTTRIDKLEAKDQAASELRRIADNKMEHLSESIGEIKELFKVIEDEKKDLEVKISETQATVKAANPKLLLKEVDGLKKEITVLHGKLDLVQKHYTHFKKDFDRFDHKLKVFKGEDELIKIQERTKEELREIHKVNHTVSMHASKLENHFIKINEKVNAATLFMKDMTEIKKELEKLQTQLGMKIETVDERLEVLKQEGAHTPDEYDELHETLDQLAALTTETFGQLKAKQVELADKQGLMKSELRDYDKIRKWVSYLAKQSGTKESQKKTTRKKITKKKVIRKPRKKIHKK